LGRVEILARLMNTSSRSSRSRPLANDVATRRPRVIGGKSLYFQW
jgi:hypothetical protein